MAELASARAGDSDDANECFDQAPAPDIDIRLSDNQIANIRADAMQELSALARSFRATDDEVVNVSGPLANVPIDKVNARVESLVASLELAAANNEPAKADEEPLPHSTF